MRIRTPDDDLFHTVKVAIACDKLNETGCKWNILRILNVMSHCWIGKSPLPAIIVSFLSLYIPVEQ